MPTWLNGLPAMPLMLGVLAVLAIAYRYYSAFLAARVAALDDTRITPAHRFNDGRNFHPTHKWVLFGHHFAAISGAGPLIGPVLALQFGYLPGLIWLVIGVCLAGAVQDMMVMFASVRRGGKSLAGIAREELGPTAGTAASLAILYIIIIALAGLGIVVVKALAGETIPYGSTNPARPAILIPPPDAPVSRTLDVKTGLTTYNVPPGSIYHFGPSPEDQLRFEEPFQLVYPTAQPLQRRPAEEGGGYLLPPTAKRIVSGSSWGTFTIAATIPIALFVGMYMNKLRPGKVVEASLIGAALVLGATFAGAWIPGSPLERLFDLTREEIILAMGVYGFVAAVLPVWLLLGPRDYLSTFLKIGTIVLLVVGVLLANPTIQAPAINPVFLQGGGPYFNGPVFPYVFICIMCGAISGFHALVASGTTPKMIDRESHIRPIGYGAMLMEGLVGVVALIAAASMPNKMYYDINIDLARKPDFVNQLRLIEQDGHGHAVGDPAAAAAARRAQEARGDELVAIERQVGEQLHGRTGGAVTLAVGMARIFEDAMPFFKGMLSYWYHFAIMFEALFILTTIDAGTRIGRFLLQENLGKIYRPFANLEWRPGAWLATGLVVGGWCYFIATGTVDTIWPMFGLANQLLALIALAVVSAVLISEGKLKYVWVTMLPLTFVGITTSTAAAYEIRRFYAMMYLVEPAKRWGEFKGWLNIGLTFFLIVCAAIVLVAATRRWLDAYDTHARARRAKA
ncbi:carbon starvation protein CstA [Isosphaera pallida ATCC 43644]|uniref:Carbon starvation protein CstA n=1 Tax=Isosphaera pallida (strain ATCC 43644 / DSM 9630 / IS1B) TaxID=575540 RepID=E8R0Y4_ISOPI|nr:carbon starvation protein A [Isosphaera pallida]ADV62330.1 carbon starvation protein CstA [Isosphaera pallida ATCC 43644]